MLLAIPVFAAVVQDAGGEDGIVPGMAGGDAFEVEQVEGKADYGAGVTDEAALPQGDGGVIFARGGGGHEPEAGGARFEDVLYQGAEPFMLDEADFGIQGLTVYYCHLIIVDVFMV